MSVMLASTRIGWHWTTWTHIR